MSCGCCSGNITQILRTTGQDCCPTLNADGSVVVVDSDGNTATLTNFDTNDLAVTLSLAGDDLTVDVNGAMGTVTLPPETVTSVSFANNVLTYVDEDGTANPIDLSGLAALPAETITSLAYDPGTQQITYDQEGGTQQVLDLSGLAAETTTSLTFNDAAGTLTFNDETGTANILDLRGFRETETTIAFDAATGILTYTPESGAVIPIDLSPLENLTTLAFDPATQRLTYTNEAGVATIADLSALNVLTTIAYDPGTNIISYVAEDGTPTNLDLSPLATVASANTPTINLAGDGAAATPLTATANISAQAGNILQAIADGLFAQETVTAIAFTAATGILRFTDEAGANTDLDLSGLMAASTTQNSPTIALAGDGTAANPLQADAVISAQAGNTLQALADGLFAASPMVNATLQLNGTDLDLLINGVAVSTVDLRTAATVIVNDALGNAIGRAFPL